VQKSFKAVLVQSFILVEVMPIFRYYFIKAAHSNTDTKININHERDCMQQLKCCHTHRFISETMDWRDRMAYFDVTMPIECLLAA